MAARCVACRITAQKMNYTTDDAITGRNRTMVAAATIVIKAAAKKAQQNVFAL